MGLHSLLAGSLADVLGLWPSRMPTLSCASTWFIRNESFLMSNESDDETDDDVDFFPWDHCCFVQQFAFSNDTCCVVGHARPTSSVPVMWLENHPHWRRRRQYHTVVNSTLDTVCVARPVG